jgi:hypothetical protein
MPNDIFQVDKKTLRSIKQIFDRMPKQANFATAGVINTIAFTAREAYIDEIDRSMTVRSEPWLRKNMRVDTTKGNIPITRQAAIAGSISTTRSTGWAEQQTGQKDKRDRAITQAARTSGSWAKKVAGKSRMKRANRPRRSYQFQRKGRGKGGGYSHMTDGQATVAMLIDKRQGKFKDNIIIGRGLPGRLSNFDAGLYGKKGKKIIRLQNFDDKPKQPRTNKWMTRGNNSLQFRVDLNKVWAEQIGRQLKFIKGIR